MYYCGKVGGEVTGVSYESLVRTEHAKHVAGIYIQKRFQIVASGHCGNSFLTTPFRNACITLSRTKVSYLNEEENRERRNLLQSAVIQVLFYFFSFLVPNRRSTALRRRAFQCCIWHLYLIAVAPEGLRDSL